MELRLRAATEVAKPAALFFLGGKIGYNVVIGSLNAVHAVASETQREMLAEQRTIRTPHICLRGDRLSCIN